MRPSAAKAGPRTLEANMGHPSRERGLRLDGQILASSKITPLNPLSINEYLRDALH
jgi:hypothetical protein